MTGVKILESNVELINPPIRTMANGDISGLVERAIGIRPPIAVPTSNQSKFWVIKIVVFRVADLAQQVVGIDLEDLSKVYFA